MSTRDLAFGGVICALSSICIIFSSLFHLIFPLAVSCAFYCLCAFRSGKLCAFLVIVTSNIIGFLIGGLGAGEILFSVLLFSPFSIIIYSTSPMNKKPWHIMIRALLFAAFSAAIYVLFVTVFKGMVGMEWGMSVGLYAFGAIWTVVMTMFGFALDKGATLLTRRFGNK